MEFCKSQARSMYSMTESERHTFTSGGVLPSNNTEDRSDNSELADTKRQLAAALAANKKLYEFRVEQLTTTSGKNAVKRKAVKSSR